MRTTLTVVGVYVLALLLASSLPVGSSDPVHGGVLLHAAVPHVHSGTARPEVAASGLKVRLSVGSTVQAGASTATEIPSSGLTPPVPHTTIGLITASDQRLRPDRAAWLSALQKPPPDPPPTSLSRA